MNRNASATRVQKVIVVVAALVGILIGLGFYTFNYAHGASYLSNEPTVCVNCHIMREHFDSWQRGSHHGVAICNDCHLPEGFFAKYFIKFENGWNHSQKFTMQNFDEPIRVRPHNREVVQRNCLRCHEELVSESIGLFIHADEHQNCVRCHREVGHGAPH